MTVDLSVLLVEDNPNDAELLLRELKRAGFHPHWQRVETEEDYLAHLHDEIDLIVADYSLPSFSAMEALRVLKECQLDIPLIVVTGTVTEAVVVESIKQGASDYLLKDRLTRLGPAITNALEEKKLRDDKREADEALRLYATELEQRVLARTIELQRSKDYVEAILSRTSDVIVLTSSDRNIEHVNPAFERLFGYSVQDIQGQPLSSLVDPEHLSLLEDELQSIRTGNESQRIEMRVRRQDGTFFAADVALAPMGEQDETAGMVCSIWDISERKRVEENLRQALEREKELSDLKSRFTSMVSHEFRTPLAIIQTSTDLLATYSQQLTAEKKIGQLEKIQLQVTRLTDLLNDILVLGKAQTVGLEFNPERFDLHRFSQEIVNEIALTAKTHRLLLSVSGDCFEMVGDVRLMRQAITNLLSNAVKYSPLASTVYLRLRCEPERIQIQVEDEGEGIAEEDQPHLFEAFYRAKSVSSIPGTGLGLSIVKQAIETHGGEVTCESQVGHGTIFTLSVPLLLEDMPLKMREHMYEKK